MQYFDVFGIGYIVYMCKWGFIFVLLDLVCVFEYFVLMLEYFYKCFLNVCYIQVFKLVVDVLYLCFGLYGIQFGSEFCIDLLCWLLIGKKKQILCIVFNQVEKNNIMVKECFSDDYIWEIFEVWICICKCKSNEICFLICFMEMSYWENEWYFYVYQDGKVVGFIYFDLVYWNNEIISYVFNIFWVNVDFCQGIFYILMVYVMEVFKVEGVFYLDLGLIFMLLDVNIEYQESCLFK